ncbi:MAG: hypothetical protein Q4B84_03555 [Clostridia bacterium]|nr:hypothetical protein [Clostridia bacterium]
MPCDEGRKTRGKYLISEIIFDNKTFLGNGDKSKERFLLFAICRRLLGWGEGDKEEIFFIFHNPILF